MNIGFIGLGNMGGPMAANLTMAGHVVRGFDPLAPMPDGVTRAATAAGTAANAEVIITMLPNGAILRSVADEGGRGMDFPAMLPRFEKRGRG